MTNTPAAKTPSKLAAAFEQFLGSQQAAVRFRQSDVAAVLYPLLRPRDHQVAAEHAASLVRTAAKANRIERTGHLHWKTRKVEVSRKLLDGRKVPEGAGLAHLTLNTRCPAKWAAVDLETGEIWQGAPGGTTGGTWERATAATAAIVLRAAKKAE